MHSEFVKERSRLRDHSGIRLPVTDLHVGVKLVAVFGDVHDRRRGRDKRPLQTAENYFEAAIDRKFEDQQEFVRGGKRLSESKLHAGVNSDRWAFIETAARAAHKTISQRCDASILSNQNSNFVVRGTAHFLLRKFEGWTAPTDKGGFHGRASRYIRNR